MFTTINYIRLCPVAILRPLPIGISTALELPEVVWKTCVEDQLHGVIDVLIATYDVRFACGGGVGETDAKLVCLLSRIDDQRTSGNG